MKNNQVTIGAIVAKGAADKEGTLRTGDELLTVDGQKVTRMGHNQVEYRSSLFHIKIATL